jgi:hypothetical protein
MPAKDLMDAYKENMTVPYESKDIQIFNNYIEYAKLDATVLFPLRDNNFKRQK